MHIQEYKSGMITVTMGREEKYTLMDALTRAWASVDKAIDEYPGYRPGYLDLEQLKALKEEYSNLLKEF